jgi:hypothetical protein
MMSYEGASNKKSWIVFASLRLLFGGASIKKSWIVFASLRLLFGGASMPFSAFGGFGHFYFSLRQARLPAQK